MSHPIAFAPSVRRIAALALVLAAALLAPGGERAARAGEADEGRRAGRVDSLVKALGGDDARAATRAKRQLVKMGPSVIPDVRAAFDAAREGEPTKRKARVLRSAIEVLGAVRDQGSREAFEEILRDDAEVLNRNACAYALGLIGSLDSLPTLAHVSRHDASEYVRQRSIEALEALSATVLAIPAGPERDAALKRYMSLALPPIRLALDDKHFLPRLQAAKTLGALHDVDSAPKIAVQLLANDAEPRVRQEAAKALGLLTEPSTVPTLGDAVMRDKSKEVRIAAGVALGQIGDPRAVPALSAMSRDPDRDVRIVAVHGLGNMAGDADAIAPLIARVDDEDRSVSKTACDALRRLTGESPGIGEPNDWKQWAANR